MSATVQPELPHMPTEGPAPGRALFMCRSKDGTEALYCQYHKNQFKAREGMK